MKKRLDLLALCIAIPIFVGGISGFISSNSMNVFQQLNKPPLSPPGWLFPIVWTILFILMGIASYLVIVSGKKQEDINKAIIVYAIQLIVNFFWSIFFFNFGWYLFSFFWLLLLWVLIIITIILFYPISKPAAYLMIPYLLWVTFAGYLNLFIFLIKTYYKHIKSTVFLSRCLKFLFTYREYTHIFYVLLCFYADFL